MPQMDPATLAAMVLRVAKMSPQMSMPAMMGAMQSQPIVGSMMPSGTPLPVNLNPPPPMVSPHAGFPMTLPAGGFRPPMGGMASMPVPSAADPATVGAAGLLQMPVAGPTAADSVGSMEHPSQRQPKPSLKAQRTAASPQQVAATQVRKPAFVCLVDDFCNRVLGPKQDA